MKKLLATGWSRLGRSEWQNSVEDRLSALTEKVNEVIDKVEPPPTPKEVLDDAEDLNARAARAMGWRLDELYDGKKWWVDGEDCPVCHVGEWSPVTAVNQAMDVLLHVCDKVKRGWRIENPIHGKVCVVIGYSDFGASDDFFSCAVTKAAVEAWEKRDKLGER